MQMEIGQVKNRGTEDHKIWLFDLAHENLNREKIVKGFIKYYALNGFTIGNVQDDIVFRTMYQPELAMRQLMKALQEAVDE